MSSSDDEEEDALPSSSNDSPIGMEGVEKEGEEGEEEEEEEVDLRESWDRVRTSQVILDVPVLRADDADADNSVRLVLMSDTHAQHSDVVLPSFDDDKDVVLIHAGDITKSGEAGTIAGLAEYFQRWTASSTAARGGRSKKHRQAICIAGNHDLSFDADFYERHWNRFQRRYDPASREMELLKRSCTYLEDSSCVIRCNSDNTCVPNNLLVYGSPWSSRFYDWAFNVSRGKASAELWARIPDEADVLITHGPPLGRGDRTSAPGNLHVGCYDLLRQVQERIKPRVHVFGHIHEGRGLSYDGTTLYVNACSVDRNYDPQPCIVVDLPFDTTKPAKVVKPRCQLRTPQRVRDWFLTPINKQEYPVLRRYFESLDVNDFASFGGSFPSGNDLLVLYNDDDDDDAARKAYTPTALERIVDCLRLHRDGAAQKELRRALLRIYAGSY